MKVMTNIWKTDIFNILCDSFNICILSEFGYNPFFKKEFFFFFDVDHFFEVIIEFVTVLFLVYVLGLGAWDMES